MLGLVRGENVTKNLMRFIDWLTLCSSSSTGGVIQEKIMVSIPHDTPAACHRKIFPTAFKSGKQMAGVKLMMNRVAGL